MKAIVVSNGEMLDNTFYKELFKRENPEYIICADGGAHHLRKVGILPTTIIGDLDSIPKDDLDFYKNKNIEIVKYPTQKDETDTQLAVQYAMNLPVKEIILLGMIGNRMDHSLANIYLLKSIIRRGFKAYIINENNCVHLVKKDLELVGSKGDILSLLPFTDRVEGITTEGLYYPLKNAIMEKDNPYGISNVFVNKKIKISIKQGLLLVIQAKDN